MNELFNTIQVAANLYNEDQCFVNPIADREANTQNGIVSTINAKHTFLPDRIDSKSMTRLLLGVYSANYSILCICFSVEYT